MPANASAFSRIYRPGKDVDGNNVFVKAEVNNGRLSITRVVGPMRNGDAKGSCGQTGVEYIAAPAPGWTPEMIARLGEIWDRWHLNDMRAGSPAQMAWLRANPITAVYPESHYDKACKALALAGLDPDPATGYRYGHAWLTEELPAEVVDELAAFPETDVTPAWV